MERCSGADMHAGLEVRDRDERVRLDPLDLAAGGVVSQGGDGTGAELLEVVGDGFYNTRKHGL